MRRQGRKEAGQEQSGTALGAADLATSGRRSRTIPHWETPQADERGDFKSGTRKRLQISVIFINWLSNQPSKIGPFPHPSPKISIFGRTPKAEFR